MGRRASRLMVTAFLAGGFVVVGSGVALAVSGGGYDPAQQDCSATADSTANKTQAEPGCHTFKVNVEDGSGARYAEAGVDQMPDGPSGISAFLVGVGKPGDPNFPNSGCASVDTNGTGGGPGTGCGTTGSGVGADGSGSAYDPASGTITPHTGTPDPAAVESIATNGVDFYLGADDNLDAGEHDGVTADPANGTDRSANGPSDGGAITAHVTPTAAATTPSLSDPVPVAGASEGFCADGICQEVTTHRQVVYNGGGGSGDSRDVANYDKKTFEPESCSSGSPEDEKSCGDKTMNEWRDAEASNVYAEPGVQTYGDPDPQSSPIDPVASIADGAGMADPAPSLYPLPGIYAGTCGVVAGTPNAPAPSSPFTNRAGQVDIATGC